MAKMTKEQRQARLTELKTLADAYSNGTDEATIRKTHPHLIGRYSFRNVCLILSQKQDALECAGFNDWLKVGRCVRKGEKGLAILVPMSKRDDDEESVWFTWRYVFDISQTEAVTEAVA